MPLLKSSFNPSLPLKNGHLSSVYRILFMKESQNYQRERITTWDNDFIDLDFSRVGASKLVILIHGLEGSAESKYMLAATTELNNEGFDTVSFNLRGCSGEDNNLLATYHSGKTEDLSFVIDYILENYHYKKIALVGYSLGGNMTLKYMGEWGKKIPKQLKAASAISVPCDLASSSKELELFKNKIYMEEFLKSLRLKVLEKAHKFPDYKVDKDKLFKAKSFSDFDEIYTAPVFGFKNAQDYWEKSSSKPYLPKIKKPTLLITALDDPFLSQECYPYEEAKNSKHFFLEAPKYGGHCGFITNFINQDNRWLEHRIINFILQNV